MPVPTPQQFHDRALAHADPEADAVWANDRWTLVAFGEPRLPLAVMVMPRAHLDFGDLDDALAAELGVISARVAAGALADLGESRL